MNAVKISKNIQTGGGGGAGAGSTFAFHLLVYGRGGGGALFIPFTFRFLAVFLNFTPAQLFDAYTA